MKVVIAGCGDLGTEVGLRFIAAGHQVLGLRRSPDVLPASFERSAVDLSQEIPDLPPDVDVLVVATAAGGRTEANYISSYRDVVANLIAAMARDNLKPKRVIFVSSTAVYDVKDGSWVDENTVAAPPTATAAVLRETEKLIETEVPNGIVFRLGGIYGPGRDRLINQVREAKAVLSEAPNYTNRIHRDDAAEAIVHLATVEHQPSPLYLGVDNDPADRSDVLRFLASHLGVQEPPLEASATDLDAGKRCRNDLLRDSGFTFGYPSYREGYPALLAGHGTRHR